MRNLRTEKIPGGPSGGPGPPPRARHWFRVRFLSKFLAFKPPFFCFSFESHFETNLAATAENDVLVYTVYARLDRSILIIFFFPVCRLQNQGSGLERIHVVPLAQHIQLHARSTDILVLA